MPSADQWPTGLTRDTAANDNIGVERREHGLHLRLRGADILISHYPGGVSLGLMTGEIRCGVGLTRADAEALADALLKGAIQAPGG
jgi:hypothetical protein